MVRLHEEELPQISVAVHVLVILYVPAHEPGVVSVAKVIVTDPEQLSVAVGGINIGTAGQLIGVA